MVPHICEVRKNNLQHDGVVIDYECGADYVKRNFSTWICFFLDSSHCNKLLKHIKMYQNNLRYGLDLQKC